LRIVYKIQGNISVAGEIPPSDYNRAPGGN